jgi:cobalt-precorrin 5A hydrolase
VVVLDPEGRFAVPILSGHLGGANELAREVGRRLGATPVITTATDASGRPAVEVWAREQGLRTEGREGIVAINAAWANGEPVGAYADPALGRHARDALQPLAPHLAVQTEDQAQARAFRGALLAVTHRELPDLGAALFVRPRCLALGVGCRRDAPPAVVEQGVREALATAGLSALAVAVVATVDAKGDEPALHSLAHGFDVRLRTFRAATLSGVPVPTPSARVRKAVGTPSVAEAAALAASGGTLVLAKVKGRVWTLAAAVGAPLGRCDAPTMRFG